MAYPTLSPPPDPIYRAPLLVIRKSGKDGKKRGEERRSYAEAKNQLRHEYAQACIRNKIPAAIGSPPEAINMPNGSMTRHDEIANVTQRARTHA